MTRLEDQHMRTGELLRLRRVGRDLRALACDGVKRWVANADSPVYFQASTFWLGIQAR